VRRKPLKSRSLYIGRGAEYGSWCMKLGRFFIGLWFQSEVGWNWWFKSEVGNYKFIAFGVGEIRWYNSG